MISLQKELLPHPLLPSSSRQYWIKGPELFTSPGPWPSPGLCRRRWSWTWWTTLCTTNPGDKVEGKGCGNCTGCSNAISIRNLLFGSEKFLFIFLNYLSSLTRSRDFPVLVAENLVVKSQELCSLRITLVLQKQLYKLIWVSVKFLWYPLWVNSSVIYPSTFINSCTVAKYSKIALILPFNTSFCPLY